MTNKTKSTEGSAKRPPVNLTSPIVEPISFAKKFVMELCKLVNTPKSLAVYLLLESNEYEELLHLGIDPMNYTEIDTCKFRSDLLVTEILSKAEFLPLNRDTELLAMEGFASNIIETHLKSGCFVYKNRSLRVRQVIREAKRHIRMLFQRPIETERLNGRWGPGSTTSLCNSGRNYVLPKKITEYPIVISESAFIMHTNLISDNYHFLNEVANVNASGPTCLLKDSYIFNEFADVLVVPKNAKIGRVITRENSGNIFSQLAYGDEVRKRLKRYWGIDLDDQQINQKLARIGSDIAPNSEKLCTVDLRRASDSVLITHIEELLPREVAEIFLNLRTPGIRFKLGDNKPLHEVFPSFYAGMGNGLTFPLEVVVFHALNVGVHRVLGLHEIIPMLHTYGDDIICHQEAYDLLSEVFSCFGFEINHKKSYKNSLYRESCGEQFFGGCCVTPFYVRNFNGTLPSLIKMHNSLLRYIERYSLGSKFLVLIGKLFKKVLPEELRWCLSKKEDIPEADLVWYTYSEKCSNGSYLIKIVPENTFISQQSAYLTWHFTRGPQVSSIHSNDLLYILYHDDNSTWTERISAFNELYSEPITVKRLDPKTKSWRFSISCRGEPSYQLVKRLKRKELRNGYCQKLHGM